MKRIQIANVIIEKNGKVLMLRRNYDPGKNKLDLLGGFIEKDESVEEAAIREAKEESGFEVKLTEKLGEFDYFDREEKTMHVFIGKITGGELKNSHEGRPVWMRVFDIKSETLAFPQVHVRILNNFIKTRGFQRTVE